MWRLWPLLSHHLGSVMVQVWRLSQAPACKVQCGALVHWQKVSAKQALNVKVYHYCQTPMVKRSLLTHFFYLK